MHIEVTYADGTKDEIPVGLGVERVSEGSMMIPGHDVGKPPARTGWEADYFCAALDEGHEREGAYEPIDEDGDGEAFTWRLVGTERDHCLDRLRHWMGVVGPDWFDDPHLEGNGFSTGRSSMAKPLPPGVTMSDADRVAMDEDLQVADFYVMDHQALLDEAREGVGTGPSPC